MSEAKKSKLAIHHSNLFYPKPSGITKIARNPSHVLLATVREPIDSETAIENISFIDVYEIKENPRPRLLFTIVEAERITGITWISEDKFLTTSRQHTINIYHTKKERKVLSLITDYGPISCLQYSLLHRLLITGTEYGYVVAYKIDKKFSGLEVTQRMVKINNRIRCIDFNCRPRDKVEQKIVAKPPKKSSKRKRRDSSEEDDSEVEEVKVEEYLHDTEVTIFGASNGDVIAWDYHKKTIIETMKVGVDQNVVDCLLVLKSGDIIAGDSSGTISIIDKNTYTCKLNSRPLQSRVLCIAEHVKKRDSKIIISGEDPTIIQMSNDRSGHYMLEEKLTFHTHAVTGLLFLDHKTILSASTDGQLVTYNSSRNQENRKTITKIVTPPNFKDKIKFSNRQMMIQEDKTLKIWSLPLTVTSSPRKGNNGLENHDPTKLLLVKSKNFIHSSVFSSRWIVYSTDRGLYIFDRSDDKLKTFRTSIDVGPCKSLELCSSDRYLFAASLRLLYVIDLHGEASEEPGTEDTAKTGQKKNRPCKLVIEKKTLDACIQQMLYFDQTDQLVVSCARPKKMLLSIKLDHKKRDGELLMVRKASLRDFDIKFMTYNAAIKRDRNVYLYTSVDKIMKVDLSQDNFEEAVAAAALSAKKLEGLMDNANILGMIILSRDQCIIFDDSHLLKVDLTLNRVVNQNSDYAHIVNIDNTIYQKPDRVALAELRHDDYLRLLPPITVKLRSKFGDA